MASSDLQLQFTTNLLRDLSQNATVDAFVSPLSIILALSMAYVGAGGKTRQEFNHLFCGYGKK
jgi:serine protease inhibitor